MGEKLRRMPGGHGVELFEELAPRLAVIADVGQGPELRGLIVGALKGFVQEPQSPPAVQSGHSRQDILFDVFGLHVVNLDQFGLRLDVIHAAQRAHDLVAQRPCFGIDHLQ